MNAVQEVHALKAKQGMINPISCVCVCVRLLGHQPPDRQEGEGSNSWQNFLANKEYSNYCMAYCKPYSS